METNPIKLNTVILSILVIAAVEIAARMLIGRNLIAPLIGLGLARLAEIILLLSLVTIRPEGSSAIGLTLSKIYQGFKKGLIWAFSFGVAAGLVLFILYHFGFNVPALFQTKLPASPSGLITFLLVGAFIGPVAEEIFFRGIVYGFFRKWGIAAAIIVSTLLFVLAHASGPTLPVTQVVGGILFAVLYEVEKNLLVPITVHSLGNLAIFVLTLVI